MNSTQIGFINNHLAETLLNWAYRYCQPKQIDEAIGNWLRSLRYGNEAQNNVALSRFIRWL